MLLLRGLELLVKCLRRLELIFIKFCSALFFASNAHLFGVYKVTVYDYIRPFVLGENKDCLFPSQATQQ